jgi:hypothetical protein
MTHALRLDTIQGWNLYTYRVICSCGWGSQQSTDRALVERTAHYHTLIAA